MRIKVIRGKTMRAAMTNVVKMLGEDALILSTRAIGSDGYEITAALDDRLLDGTPDEQDLAPMSAEKPPASERGLSAPDLKAGVLAWHGFGAQSADLSSRDIEAYVAANFRFKPLPLGRGAPPIVVCGAPGSGKTVYVARLATRLVLAGQRPLVITADTDKAGAVEQLAACTRLLGVELIAADGPSMIRRVCREAGQGRCIIIDTSGTCDLDEEAMAKLAEIRRAAGGRLVLMQPAGGDPDDVSESVGRFQAIGADRMVLTKADCVRRFAGALHAARGGMALVEAGTGSSVIGGTVQLDAVSLARLLIAQRDKYASGKNAVSDEREIMPDMNEPDDRSATALRGRTAEIAALGGIEFSPRTVSGTAEMKVGSSRSVLTRHIAMQAARHG